eukprot:1165302-Rhodomonas_salina.2
MHSNSVLRAVCSRGAVVWNWLPRRSVPEAPVAESEALAVAGVLHAETRGAQPRHSGSAPSCSATKATPRYQTQPPLKPASKVQELSAAPQFLACPSGCAAGRTPALLDEAVDLVDAPSQRAPAAPALAPAAPALLDQGATREAQRGRVVWGLSLIHISEPTRPRLI